MGWEFLLEASEPFAPSYRHNRESRVASEQLGHSEQSESVDIVPETFHWSPFGYTHRQLSIKNFT